MVVDAFTRVNIRRPGFPTTRAARPAVAPYQIHRTVGRGCDVGRGLGVSLGVELGVGEAVGVPVGVGLTVAVGVGLGVGDCS
jgi:hypothetical protein